jgi:gas vesicle protein
MFNTRESIIALITGAITGLAAGLLLAPASLVRSRKGPASQIDEVGADEEADEVDLGGVTTAPLSEISEDADQLVALRSKLEAGQS